MSKTKVLFVCLGNICRSPLAEGIFRVGSTYNNHDLTYIPTDEGKNYLLSKLKGLINVQVKIKDHYVGIRPATKDRKPLVGIHPIYETIGVYNGLGTKGVTLSPYFAKLFASHLVNGTNLADEVNIERYFSLYFNSQNS